MKHPFRVVTLLTLIGALLMLGIACNPATPAAPATPTTTAQTGGVAVIINAPASNSDFEQGAQVSVNSTSTSPNGIVLVELIVDGRVVQSSPTPNGQPQQQFAVLQTWQATAGQHTLTVRATDLKANTGNAAIIVNVGGAVVPTGQPTIVPPATLPPPTPIPATSIPPTCALNSTFLRDVTIPDGTTIAPGGPFVKTWQVQNSGTCDWGAGFTLVFISGTQMAGASPSPIPATPAGQAVNLSVNMVAPTQPGRYQGVWQLQASNGALFGTRVDVIIVVPGAPTPVPPTAPPATCSGIPQISSFVANPSTIQPGQIAILSWGLVTNATNVVLQTPQGNSGVVTPGQVQVQPGSTTTYTLAAYCYNNAVQAQTTVTVRNAPPTPTPPPSNPNQIRNIQAQKSGDNYKVTVEYFWNGTDAPAYIRAVGVNAGSDPVTNYGQASILANFVKFVIVNLTGKGAVTIDVCMMGHSGAELACSSKAVR